MKKKYVVIGASNNGDLKMIESLLNDGWQIERSDLIGDRGAAYILFKEV